MIGVVDIGGTKIAVGVVDAASPGVLRARREELTLPERGFARAVERIAQMLRDALDETQAAFPAQQQHLEGVAIGSTGPIDRETGVFGPVDTLPGFQGASLTTALQDALFKTATTTASPKNTTTASPPAIVIENDADAAALGEATFGSGRGAKRFVYVTISTGIGGGIVLNGRIYRGANGVHPEVGHHTLEASGPRCPCGARGCWEILASGPAMASWARTSYADNADNNDNNTNNNDNALLLPDPNTIMSELTAELICQRAREGKAWACAIVRREAFYIGVGLSNLIAMFAPDVIALGGGVMRSAPLFLDRIHEVVKTTSTALVPASTTKIVTATLGADAGLLGAAQAFILVMHQHKSKNDEAQP